jgi:hypothetical protein
MLRLAAGSSDLVPIMRKAKLRKLTGYAPLAAGALATVTLATVFMTTAFMTAAWADWCNGRCY